MSKKEFNFLSSFSNFLHDILNRMKELGDSFNNIEIINFGRSDAEKETIKEICEDLDTQCELMKELEDSNLTPKDWYQKKSAELLEQCDEETFAEIKKLDAEISRNRLQTELVILDNLAENIGQASSNKGICKKGEE